MLPHGVDSSNAEAAMGALQIYPTSALCSVPQTPESAAEVSVPPRVQLLAQLAGHRVLAIGAGATSLTAVIQPLLSSSAALVVLHDAANATAQQIANVHPFRTN